jgi:antitoxin component of MazEF toxin-antitoxin module
MSRAILWLLREYPGTRHGLSRLQRKMLKNIGLKEPTKVSVVVGSLLRTESVGDTSLLDLLNSCAEVEQPLVILDGQSDPARKHLEFVSQVVLTDVGRRVLSGKSDHIELNGIDRWIGGVHLFGRRVPWRWDAGLRRIVQGANK